MRAVVLAFIASASMFAAVEGVVTNQTTGKAQASVEVSLVKLGEGMDTVGTVKSDAEGKFRFDKDVDPASPYLVQTVHQGVNYNKVLPPGARTTAISLNVYNVAAN